MEPMPRSIQTTGKKAACLHDATSAFDHEDNLDGQSDTQGTTRTDRAAINGRFCDIYTDISGDVSLKPLTSNPLSIRASQ